MKAVEDDKVSRNNILDGAYEGANAQQKRKQAVHPASESVIPSGMQQCTMNAPERIGSSG